MSRTTRDGRVPAAVEVVASLWAPRPASSLASDALRPRVSDAALFSQRLSAFASAHPPMPTLAMECARFAALGGAVAVAPSDTARGAESGDGFSIGIAADDFLFPICMDGRHCSQVMHIALCSAMRALGVDPRRAVAAPHGVGAETTNDPAPTDAGSRVWAPARVRDVAAADAWRADAVFAEAFGAPADTAAEEAERAYSKAACAGTAQLRELSAEHAERRRQAALLGRQQGGDGESTPLPAYMSAWFSRHYYARQAQKHGARRMVFVCFGRSADVVVGRIVAAARAALERGGNVAPTPGARPCDNMHVVVLPWRDTISKPTLQPSASGLLASREKMAATPGEAKRAHERFLRKCAALISPVLGRGGAASSADERSAQRAFATSAPLTPLSPAGLGGGGGGSGSAGRGGAAPYASPTPGADALRAQIAELAQSLQLDASGGLAMAPTAFSPEKEKAAGGAAAPRARAVHIDRHGSVSIDLAPPAAAGAAASSAARGAAPRDGRGPDAADVALRDSLIMSASKTRSDAAEETVPLAAELHTLETRCAAQRALLARFADGDAIAFAARSELVEQAVRVAMLRAVRHSAAAADGTLAGGEGEGDGSSREQRTILAQAAETARATFEREAERVERENETRRATLRRLEDAIVHVATQELRISRGDAERLAGAAGEGAAFPPEQQLLAVEMAPPAHELEVAIARVRLAEERRNLEIGEEIRAAVAATMDSVQVRGASLFVRFSCSFVAISFVCVLVRENAPRQCCSAPDRCFRALTSGPLLPSLVLAPEPPASPAACLFFSAATETRPQSDKR